MDTAEWAAIRKDILNSFWPELRGRAYYKDRFRYSQRWFTCLYLFMEQQC